MMADQAQRLRELAEKVRQGVARKAGITAPVRQGRRGRVIAVTSGKGGVGKTNFTINLGLALVERGQEVLVFDADLGLANADLVLGECPPFNLGHYLRGDKGIFEVVHRGPLGLRLVSGGSGLEELLLVESQVEHFIAGLSLLGDSADVVLVDTGAGLSRKVMGFLLAAEEIIVVTTPEPTAMADAYATIKAVSRHNPAAWLGLVVNLARDRREAEVTAQKLAQVSERFLSIHLERLGFIPLDPCVALAVREQQPFLMAYPASPASRYIRRLAASLQPGEKAGRTAGGTFWARLGRWLGGAGR